MTPEIPEQPGSIPEEERERRIAAKIGENYILLLKTYLGAPTVEEPTIKEREEQTEALSEPLFKGLSEEERKEIESIIGLHGEGVSRLQEEIEANHKLLEPYKGREVESLLEILIRTYINRWMCYYGRSEEQIKKITEGILQQIRNKASFAEPLPGVAIIEVDKGFFELLEKNEIYPELIHPLNFIDRDPNKPSFIIMPKERNSIITPKREDPRVLHTMHHFIWNFLEKGGFVREPKETTQELNEAFCYFRHELAGHIIEGRDIRDIRDIKDIKTEYLVYTKDKEIFELAKEAQIFVSVCMEIARKKGVDPQIFLYAIMSSESFEELKNKFARLTPPLHEKDLEGITNDLHWRWRSNKREVRQISELLNRKNLILPRELIEEYLYGQMENMTRDLKNLGDAIWMLKHFKITEFANDLNLEIDEKELIKRVLQKRLPFPGKIIDIILSLEQSHNIPDSLLELLEGISLGNPPEES